MPAVLARCPLRRLANRVDIPLPGIEDEGWQAQWPAAFIDAGEDLRRRLDADRTRGLAVGSPDWRLFALTVADEDVLPAALAALGYRHRVATHMEAPGWWPDAAGPIVLMAEAAGAHAVIAIEFWLGRWSHIPDCGIRGGDLLELAGHRWAMTRGKAAFKLARLLGRQVPRVIAP